MILFCGIPSEPPLRLAIAAAAGAGIPHVVLNQREVAAHDLMMQVDDGGVSGVLGLHGREHPLEGFTGVYVRLMDVEALPELRPRAADPSQVERARALHRTLLDWLDLAACTVANRPSAMGSNVSKPYQAGLIARSGFATPHTLITNRPEELERFTEANGDVIFKSISSVRSIVRRLGDAEREELGRVRHLPTQFQALVAGTDVRVHVVGSRVFPTVIRSEAVDYRYARQDGQTVEMEPCALPDEVARRCAALTAHLGLALAGIDLIRRPDGEFYCLEVNPSPGFSYVEETTGQPIADALVHHLAGNAAGGRSHDAEEHQPCRSERTARGSWA